MINQELANVLACPACKQSIAVVEDKVICQSPSCGLRFPIRDGIPIMLIDEAEKPSSS